MDSTEFLVWMAARRCVRKTKKLKLAALRKIVLSKQWRDDLKKKRRAFRRIKKSDYRFYCFLRRRFNKIGEDVPFSIEMWARESTKKLIKIDSLSFYSLQTNEASD